MSEVTELGKKIDAALDRQPVIVVSGFEKWLRYALIGLLVVDLVLTGFLLVGLNNLATLSDRNTALNCRNLIANGDALDPKGSCYAPSVLRFYDPETGESR